MRSFAVLLAACGGAASSTPVTPTVVQPTGPGASAEEAHRPPVDPIAALTPDDEQPRSWLAPGPVLLELGGATIESPGGSRPIEISIIDRASTFVRAAVRLPRVRFSLWSDRARLFGVLARDHRVTGQSARPSDMFALLRAGARVKRLARKDKQTQVRFIGAVEVETWVPDELLVDEVRPAQRVGRIPTGRRPAQLMPGTVVRSEPQWGNNQLAVVIHNFVLDSVQELADGWVEVAYQDGDVSLRGFASRRAPPGQVHRPRDPDVPPPVITPNTKVPAGTCLYVKRGGQAIGYITDEHDVQLDDAGNGWWTLSVDTPWGPIGFAAKGPSGGLDVCAPAGAIAPPP